jgi:hypothetical protein
LNEGKVQIAHTVLEIIHFVFWIENGLPEGAFGSASESSQRSFNIRNDPLESSAGH